MILSLAAFVSSLYPLGIPLMTARDVGRMHVRMTSRK